MKPLMQGVLFTVYFFVCYTVFFGALIFNLPIFVPSDLSYDKEAILMAEQTDNKAYILDDIHVSFDARLALIEAAEEQIKISYYTIHGGESRDVFYGAILEAADRGVNVEIIIDYIFYFQTRGEALPNEALYIHENIDFRLYEPYHPLLPYTIHNRLHDKMMMIDENYGVLGGRNIGDRYFHLGEEEDYVTFDRDVLVFSEDKNPTVKEMNAYYDELFNSPFSVKRMVSTNQALLDEQDRLKTRYTEYKQTKMIAGLLDTIHQEAITVESAHFLRSPLTRFHKEPVILRTLSEIAIEYDEWFVQSPYIIFHRFMNDALPKNKADDITILTNAKAVTPNIFAMSGYRRYRDDLAENTTLYEYQGPGSIHAKGMTFGDEISVIGTLNLDPRSATLSTESVIVIVSKPFTEHYHEVLDTYIERSLLVLEDGTYQSNPDIDEADLSTSKYIAIRFMGFLTYFIEVML